MEAFSYQHHHLFLPDSPDLPTFPFEMPFPVQQYGETRNDSASCFSYYSPEDIQEVSAIDARAYERSSSLNISCTSVGSEMAALSSVAIQPHHEKIPKQVSMEKRIRKNGYGDCLSRDQSKETKEINRRNQRKHNGELNRKRKKSKGVDSKATVVAGEEAPLGYILVRARRGQATDSHSLAERVRREKISARMKKLQGLVPGCDKATGKALLDETISYIGSLQNQVKFLSMELASVNSMLYGFGVDFVDCMNKPENMGIIPQHMQLDLVSQTTHVLTTAHGSMTENYQIMDPSTPL